MSDTIDDEKTTVVTSYRERLEVAIHLFNITAHPFCECEVGHTSTNNPETNNPEETPYVRGALGWARRYVEA